MGFYSSVLENNDNNSKYNKQVHQITPNQIKCYKVKVTLLMFTSVPINKFN